MCGAIWTVHCLPDVFCLLWHIIFTGGATSCRKGCYWGVWRCMKHLKSQGITPSLGSSSSLAHLVPLVTGRKSCEQHASLPAQHKPFAELLWRQSWAVLQWLLSTQKSNDQYGQVSISMRHAHPKKKKKALHLQRFPRFYFLEDFPWFPPKQRRFKYIYIFLYMNIYFPHTQPD